MQIFAIVIYFCIIHYIAAKASNTIAEENSTENVLANSDINVCTESTSDNMAMETVNILGKFLQFQANLHYNSL